jgi:hypothetical protein
MAALRDEVKLYIVTALACFDSPTQVSLAVKEEYNLDVPRQQVSLYDPNTYVGRNLSKKWRTIFEETRAKFRATAEEIPIASKAFRLRGLARLAQKAENMRNLPLVASLYEQAAKEMGEAYVNRRLDAPKMPGDAGEGIPTKPEYTLAPDEQLPDNPIL